MTEITRRDSDKSYSLPTDQQHRIVLKSFTGSVLDVEDVHFHFDSAVLMPDYGGDEAADKNRVTGLAALRAVYVQAQTKLSQKLLITGHTDRSGAEDYNLKLSQQRADNVLHLLLGNRDQWVAICEAKHQTEDIQQILKWASASFAWDCDPGKVDNVDGPKTKEATKKFQKRYNQERKQSIAEDGTVGKATWGAFFDMYLVQLAELLETDDQGLKSKQQSLSSRFVDGGRKAVGCGENHPLTENTVDNRRSEIDRRVEVLFFDPGEEPLLDCHPGPGKCSPGACEVYDPRMYGLGPVPVTPVKPPTAKTTIVEPKIEVEYKVVLLERGLSKHQAADETKRFATPTYVLLSATQTGNDPKYTKGAKLEIVPPNAEAYTSEACEDSQKLDLSKPIPNDKLFGATPYKIWLRGKTKGKCELKLTMEDPADGRVRLLGPAKQEIGVVELEMKLHQHDEAALANEEFDADKDTLDAYFTALNAKKIPDQKEMTDEQQVKDGRMLHAQKDGNHGRAKLVLKKLAGDWPADADEYDVVVSQDCKSGGLQVYDKETEGELKALPHKIKLKDLKAKDVELWVEGKEATKKWRDAVLEVGVDRAAGGLEKKEKRNGNWARFTVVQIKEIKLDYKPETGKADAWDEGKSRFYINFKTDPDGRKIKLAVELTEKLKDIPVHFMLAPHKDNGKNANWGIDLPGTWKWKDIEEAVKHKDRSAQKKLLHLSKKTDADGKADLEVTLSRFGGDIFEPGTYITQDPHLAKYVREHADLGKRKPVVASHTITVWRKFWYQLVRAEGLTFPPMAGAVGQYEKVRADMVKANDANVSKDDIKKMNPPAIYKKYMVYLNAGEEDALVVSDTNKAQFFSSDDLKDEADKPVKIPILVCDAQWDEGGDCGSIDEKDIPAEDFPKDFTADKLICDPPLQGGTLFVSGRWEAADWDPAADGGNGDWVNFRSGDLAAGDITVNKSRGSLKDVTVKRPAGVGAFTAGTTFVDIIGLVVKGAKGPYLGEYSPSTKRILCVYNQKSQLYKDDFQNTVAHEVGHAFRQVLKVRPAGVPAHPNQFDSQGSHCNWNTDKCLMYKSGPIAGCIGEYCSVCHPYVLVSKMDSLS